MKNLDLTLNDPEQLALVARALGSEMRLRIMQLLGERSMSIVELAQEMDAPLSTISNNVVILEKAELIRTERRNGVRGVMKLCSRKKDHVMIDLVGQENRKGIESSFQYMPIGHYTDCRITPTCGMAGAEGNIGLQDDPAVFYEPDHFGAQLLWFQSGYVEYRFSSRAAVGRRMHCMEISFEVCSEAPNYRKDWPSDITVWVNGVELGTWHCPGDFGGRQGRYSPAWWPMSATQYGLLKRWRIDQSGCLLDDEIISGVTLDQLRLGEKPYISLRIGVKDDAAQQGGINLFGEQFGDYNQAIMMRLDSVDESAAEGSDTQ